MSPNGSSLILTNLYRIIYKESHGAVVVNLTFYTLPITHKEFTILSDVQRKLSKILLQAENDVVEYVQGQFLMALLVWIGIVFVIGGFIWGYQVKLFIE